MILSEIKTILAGRDLKLTKSLGQNFLHDQNQVQRIVAAGELTPTDKVLEVGPGLGPLTEFLVSAVGEVMAIEMDRRLFDFLTEKFAATKHLTLIHDDALRYLKQHRDWQNWKLVANLPYSVASPVMVELAQADTPPARMVATLQLEVAQRIAAKAGEDHYGILSLLLQLHYEVRDSFKIPPACFFPPPDVDSACITLVLREQPLLPKELHTVFVKIVKRGFSQRRKMMLKLLKADWSEEKLRSAFEQLNISPQIRAEQVSLEDFARLTQLLKL